jgi:hypothetical protein
MSSLPNQPSSAEVQNAVRVAIEAVERNDYAAAMRILSPLHTAGLLDSPTGTSYYALCLAKTEGKFNAAAKMCQDVIDHQWFDATHHINLVKIFLAAKSRRKAVEVLERAMARLPKDETILAMRSAMGYRARPVIGFLHRDNALNIILGRMRHRRQQRGPATIGRILMWAIPLLVLWTGLIVWFLLKHS